MSQENGNESKRLSVEMSKLNVNCKEFVPRGAMFPTSIEGPSTSSLHRPDHNYSASIEGPSTSSLHRPDHYQSASIEGPSTSSLHRPDHNYSASIEGPSTSSLHRPDHNYSASIEGPSTSNLHRPDPYQSASIEGPSTSSQYRHNYNDSQNIAVPSTSSLHRPNHNYSASIEGPSMSSLHRPNPYQSASIEGPLTSSQYRHNYYNSQSIAQPSTLDRYCHNYYDRQSIAGQSMSGLYRSNYYDSQGIEEPSTSMCHPIRFDNESIAGPSTSSLSRPANFERGPSPSCSRYDYEHVSSTMPSPEDSNPTPGPSIRPTKPTLKKRRKEEIEDKSRTKKRYQEKKSLKEHINIVLVGHVDAGKSTIGGQIMSLTGMVDFRTLLKQQEDARGVSRDTWFLSWALDTNDEEREKGKTVEVGRAYFETETKHITILDAPGHKSFVPNMIGGAAQADLAILVISARKGEFETGFEKGGQTREHAMLVKSAGVKHIVVVITKMDDTTVNWDETRFIYCKETLMPFLKQLGYKSEKDLSFIPVSGLTGEGLLSRVPKETCLWYNGPSFIELLDELPSFKRNKDGPFVLPIVDKYKDMGTIVMGKVVSGSVDKGNNLLLMPNKVQVNVDQLWSDNIEVTSVASGENVKIKLKAIEEEDVSVGFVLCDIYKPVTTGRIFDAQVVILETKSIICAGYSAVMHVHCATEHVTVKALICLVDKKTGEKTTIQPRFVKQGQVVIMRIQCAGTICMEALKTFEQLGRLSLRDERENKTIAIGKILKVIK